jgi:hypothetical protein
MHTSIHAWPVSTSLTSSSRDVEFKAYNEHKAGKYFQAYGFVALEGEEDEAAAAAATAEAAASAEEEAAQAAAASTPSYSLD